MKCIYYIHEIYILYTGNVVDFNSPNRKYNDLLAGTSQKFDISISLV